MHEVPYLFYELLQSQKPRDHSPDHWIKELTGHSYLNARYEDVANVLAESICKLIVKVEKLEKANPKETWSPIPGADSLRIDVKLNSEGRIDMTTVSNYS